ncbi:hypothetical protein ABZ926_08615 [Streptomyces litmocidini]|uniref:hypothetical protein n=1 Tax=Streptomyces litmocidini TaxID=67318 RepID=UPI00340799BA
MTSVYGLADGTLLSTNDTGSVYKMVGGAPVWQETCDAPVTCGTPVKVSSWSVDARDHMNARPADGQLVQAKSGSTDLPVSVTVGGALIPFATPQEVVDAGYGPDWGAKVRGIPSRHFDLLPPIPQDGTLLQGSLGSTPVAAIVGGGRVNFASPQEVVDAGFGSDWGAKVRAVPARAFSVLPTQIMDGTRLGKSGSTSEAAVVGGARVNFFSEEERNAAGYGNRPRQLIPARVWDAMTTKIVDGTRIKSPASPTVWLITQGQRTTTDVTTGAWTVPQRVVDSIPLS